MLSGYFVNSKVNSIIGYKKPVVSTVVHALVGVSLYKLKGPQGKKEVRSGKNENYVLQEITCDGVWKSWWQEKINIKYAPQH